MFTTDAVIDTIQNGKKQFVNTFVQNEKLVDTLNKFIDSQTDYTKKAFNTGLETATAITSEMVRAAQESAKFDYTKFGEGIMKAYQTTTKK